MNTLTEHIKRASGIRLIFYAVVLLALFYLFFYLGDVWRGRELEQLKQENQKLWTDYNQAIGRAEAAESRGHEESEKGARQKMRGDALDPDIDKSKQNVKVIDDKLDAILSKYDLEKGSQHCSDLAECNRLACIELRQLKLIDKCPE